MSRAMERRVEALERPRLDSISVWFPGDPKPEGHDAASIQVEFPDYEVER